MSNNAMHDKLWVPAKKQIDHCQNSDSEKLVTTD